MSLSFHPERGKQLLIVICAEEALVPVENRLIFGHVFLLYLQVIKVHIKWNDCIERLKWEFSAFGKTHLQIL